MGDEKEVDEEGLDGGEVEMYVDSRGGGGLRRRMQGSADGTKSRGKGGTRLGGGRRGELTVPCIRSQKSIFSCSRDVMTTSRYKSLDVRSSAVNETAPRAARVARSDCSNTRRRTSRGKRRRKGTTS